MVASLLIFAVVGGGGPAFEGTLELVIYDGVEGATRVTPYLVREGAPRLTLVDAAGDVIPMEPGVRLRVEGVEEDDRLWVERADVLELPRTALVGTAPIVRSLNAVSVGFQNRPVDDSPEAVAGLRAYFHGVGKGSVADYFAEVSYGKLQFVGDAYIINLPMDDPGGPDCDGMCVLGAVQSALYNSYPQVMTTFVALIGPFGGSFASVGAAGQFNGGLAVLSSYGTAIHELGHVMGNWHTGSYFCNPGPYYDQSSGQCQGWQYGPMSAMGASGGHFQAGQKRQLGWLSQTDFVAASRGVVALAPLESASDLPRALQVGAYTIEHRRPVGFDAYGVSASGLTFAMPMGLYTPGSGYTDWVFLKTSNDDCSSNCPVLLTGANVFHDAASSLWVKVIETFPEAAMVQVHVGPSAPIAIHGLAAAVDGTAAVITWETDVPASSRVEWGIRAVALDRATPPDDSLVTSHRVTLVDLPSATDIVFRASSVAADTPGYAYGSLVTPEAPDVPEEPEPAAGPATAPAGAPEAATPAPKTAEADVPFDGGVSGGCASLAIADAWLVLALSVLWRRRATSLTGLDARRQGRPGTCVDGSARACQRSSRVPSSMTTPG